MLSDNGLCLRAAAQYMLLFLVRMEGGKGGKEGREHGMWFVNQKLTSIE